MSARNKAQHAVTQNTPVKSLPDDNLSNGQEPDSPRALSQDDPNAENPQDQQSGQDPDSLLGLSRATSLQADQKPSRTYAQRQCDDLSQRLAAAENENAVLREKIETMEENRNMLIDKVNEIQTTKQDLDESLLKQEKLRKALADQKEHLESTQQRYGNERAAQQREHSKFLYRFQDLERDEKLAWQENGTLRTKNEKFETEIVDLRSKSEEYLMTSTRYQQQRNHFKNKFEALKKQYEELEAVADASALEHANTKHQVQKVEEACATAEKLENKFKEAARAWQIKYRKAAQERDDLLKHCSDLAKANDVLRHENAIHDVNILREKLTTLNYSIREWCDQVVECKPAGTSADLDDFPLNEIGPASLADLGEHELNALIACVWEWLVKLVFGHIDRSDSSQSHPDLWTDTDTGAHLNSLEILFAGKDSTEAIKWRQRTVQQLVNNNLCEGDGRMHAAVDMILDWTKRCFHLDLSPSQNDGLRETLGRQIVNAAISLALDLRRQDSIMAICIPRTIGQAVLNHSLARRLPLTTPEENTVKLYISPQLKRFDARSGTGEASESVIVEAIPVSMPMKFYLGEGRGPNRTPQPEVECEVD